MKCAIFIQNLSTTPPSSMETDLALIHYIKLPNISYFYIRDRYFIIESQYFDTFIVQRCSFQIQLLVQLLLQVIQ